MEVLSDGLDQLQVPLMEVLWHQVTTAGQLGGQVDGRRSRLHHIAVEGDASESWGRFSG